MSTTSTDPPTITGASTTTGAMVGVHSESRPAAPVLVRSFAEFLGLSGPDGGPDANALAVRRDPGLFKFAVRGFFENGGRRLWISLVAIEADLVAAIEALPSIDDVALVAAPGHGSETVHKALIGAASMRPGLFAILDAPEGLEPEALVAWARRRRSGAAAIYAPWIVVDGPDGERTVPPSGHVMGVIARVSAARGIWKAPAGVDADVRGILRRAQALTEADQATLHPEAVNVLRAISGAGVVLWGASTLGGVGPSRHISLVRLLSWLARSLDVGMAWVGSRRNDEALWADVRSVAGAFLEEVRREGGLAGAGPSEAFYVHCDRTTMTQGDIDARRLVVLCGVAPGRPGEFVVLRMLQRTL
jgi:phage tail sheath protein FI